MNELAYAINLRAEVNAAIDVAKMTDRMRQYPEHATTIIKTMLVAEEELCRPHDWMEHDPDRDLNRYLCRTCGARRQHAPPRGGGCIATERNLMYAEAYVRTMRAAGAKAKEAWAQENRGRLSPEEFDAIMASFQTNRKEE